MSRCVHDIKKRLGETRIEDLWLPFFCVSSNLTRAEVKTHHTGPLWRAVRVSGGLPAVVPPVVFDGDLHVDGALLNNLPIDVMSQMCDGGPVIAIDVSPIVDMGENTPYGDTLSGWDLILNKINPFAEPIKIPTLPTIMQRSAEIGAVLQLKGQLAYGRVVTRLTIPCPGKPETVRNPQPGLWRTSYLATTSSFWPVMWPTLLVRPSPLPDFMARCRITCTSTL